MLMVQNNQINKYSQTKVTLFLQNSKIKNPVLESSKLVTITTSNSVG